jgi:hypothetical protein
MSAFHPLQTFVGCETLGEVEGAAMKRFAAIASLSLVGALAPPAHAAGRNPLVGSWDLQEYVDLPEGGAPVYAFGKRPVGIFVFSADGHISVSLMRNPPADDPAIVDLDPDACIPGWYCSYFGSYTYDPTGPSWTTHVIGGNIPNILGTDQRRPFKIHDDLLTITETYSAAGKTFHARRVLRRSRR